MHDPHEYKPDPMLQPIEEMGKEQGWTKEQIEDANARLWRYTKLVRSIYLEHIHKEQIQRDENRKRLKEDGFL